MPYRIEFTPEADDHLALLTARERSTLLDGVGRQLLHQPSVQTRNRKRMRPSPEMPGAMWELRIGHLRVYYEVREGEDPKVLVVAIGVKLRDRVRIGGKEIQL